MIIKNIPQIADYENPGLLKPDGESLIIDENGEMSIYTPPIYAQATGTDEQIVAMVEMADNGELDLTECQAVGDERNVELSAITSYPSGIYETHPAQTISMVLVASDTKTTDNTNPCYKYQYVTTSLNRNYPSFIIHMKNLLEDTLNKMTSNYDTSQNNCPRRTQCNDYFKPAFESDLLPIIKQVKVRTYSKTSSSIKETEDYFFLPTEKEIYGQASYGKTIEANEFPQQPYYSIISNRAKYYSGSVGQAMFQQLRSYCSENRYCCATSSSSFADYGDRASYGLVIAACI